MYHNFVRHLKIILYIIRKSKILAFGFVIMCSIYAPVCAQPRLARPIQVPGFEGVTLREVFDTLKEAHAVQFSYNSNLLDLDREIHSGPYNGLLIDYLEQLLGEKYSFKETHSHIIITYAPRRLDVRKVDLAAAKNNRARVSGYVKDVRTNKPIHFVTVYDRTTFQASALTGRNGYFEMDVRNPGNTLTIALSKENYRDTMLVLLLPVEVSDLAKRRRVGYYETSDSSKTISGSALGRFFTSSRQRIQNLNLGGFFVYSPVQVSMTPGLSTHGLLNSQVVNKFSLNIIGGYTAGVEGAELAGVFNINQFDVRGVQLAGGVNIVGGHVRGFQGAGVGNVSLNNLSGVQMAGLWNKADTTAGIQVAGGVNFANHARSGMQLAGALNVSRQEVAGQIAGGVNIAKKVRGVQIAVVNIADSSDYPIGVFNWIKNGSRQLALGIDESGFAYTHFKSGGRVLYAVVGMGAYLNSTELGYGIETALGAHLVQRPRFTLSAEIGQRVQFEKSWKYNEANRVSFKVVPAFHLSRNLQIFAAPTITYTEAIHTGIPADGAVWNFWGAKAARNTFHGGGTIGLAYAFK